MKTNDQIKSKTISMTSQLVSESQRHVKSDVFYLTSNELTTSAKSQAGLDGLGIYHKLKY